MISPNDAFMQLRERILGRSVIKKRLFLYTLQVYLAPDEVAAKGPEIWCEPSWQLTGAAGVVAGSGSIEFDPEAADPDVSVRMVSDSVDVLRGLTVDDIAIDPNTCELTVRFTGGWTLRTFVSDPTEAEQWFIHDPTIGLKLRGSPNSMNIVESA